MQRALVWMIIASVWMTAPVRPSHASGESVPELSWRRLEFQASKLLVKARAHVELTRRDAEQVRSRLLARGADRLLAPRTAHVHWLELGSSFLGRNSLTSLVVDPVDQSALQREQVETGKRRRVKLYRFCTDGVFSRRVTPLDASEEDLAPERWTRVLEEHVDWQVAQAVIDPASLFYLLSVADPKTYRDGRMLQLFSKGDVHPVELRFEGEQELGVDYQLHPPTAPAVGDTAEGVERVDRRVPALRYSLQPAHQEDALELLGLEGNLEIWIDSERRIPLLVTGKVSPVGRVAVKLQDAWLAR